VQRGESAVSARAEGALCGLARTWGGARGCVAWEGMERGVGRLLHPAGAHRVGQCTI